MPAFAAVGRVEIENRTGLAASRRRRAARDSTLSFETGQALGAALVALAAVIRIVFEIDAEVAAESEGGRAVWACALCAGGVCARARRISSRGVAGVHRGGGRCKARAFAGFIAGS